ncbi:hypothetical protein [Vreelandella alkaliphila]|uniref:Uncharacterized protein n=1 Tax=Vreelandella alkaliphila TaxID=272774 RepID=A0AAJ2S2J2_9GAMM|nr:hypothetical protein [Halomonas alkaliphila]MDX5979627.1 hypothetical protein [Halomonas alkaliphila]
MRTPLLATAILAGSSAWAMAQPQSPAVPMTDQGLQQFVAAMPSDDVLARRIYGVIEDCSCEPGSIEAVKEITVYLDGLFHHHGYGYGATVYEYLQAYTGTGDYKYEGSRLLEASGVGEFATPILNLIQAGEGDWLVSEWLMSQADMEGAQELLSR